MYTVVTVTGRNGKLILECYGPFKTKREAVKQSQAIEYGGVILIEYLWGNIINNPGGGK